MIGTVIEVKNGITTITLATLNHIQITLPGFKVGDRVQLIIDPITHRVKNAYKLPLPDEAYNEVPIEEMEPPSPETYHPDVEEEIEIVEDTFEDDISTF